jgi:hypothetical protein
MNRPTKTLIFSSTVAKILGLIREFFVFSFFGFSLEFSEALSLLAIVSAATIFSDVSILNPIYFPKWIKKQEVVIGLNTRHLLTVLIVSALIFTYNRILIKENASFILEILISFVWIPVIVNSILYSAMVYLEKFNLFKTVVILNASAFLFFMIVGVNVGGVEGYVIARYITLILTILFILYFVGKSVNVRRFEIKFSEAKKSIFSFVMVNNVLWMVLIIKVVFSNLIMKEMATINYALILAMTFYTVFSKNINTTSIKKQIITKSTPVSAFKWYFMGSAFFLSSLFFLYKVVPYATTLISYDQTLIKRTIWVAMLFTVSSVLLGFLDLKNQAALNQKNQLAISLLFMIGITFFTITTGYNYLLK